MKIIIYILDPKNIKILIILKNKIVEYSPIKIKENKPPMYSVLNPDTNSDSPSEKSNGERFDSAKIVIIQQNNNGKIII